MYQMVEYRKRDNREDNAYFGLILYLLRHLLSIDVL